MRDLPNKNELGKGSIRIGGSHYSQLPIKEARITADQLPNVDLTEKETLILEIKAKFPKHNTAYLKSRIKECEDNIVRIGKLRDEQDQMIRDYTGHISMCDFRDKEIARLPDDPDRSAAILDLKLRFPPYNVAAMKQQIQQCRDALVRCDQVVAQEYASIAEFQKVSALCEHRDVELKRAGV